VDPSVIPKLAGKWTGYVIGKSGTSAPATMNIQPDGSYRIVIVQADISATGKLSVVNGQLVLPRDHRPGRGPAPATATLTLGRVAGGSLRRKRRRRAFSRSPSK
jgi:hypothetical protein